MDPELNARAGWDVNEIEYLYAILSEQVRVIQAQPDYMIRFDWPSEIPLIDSLEVLSTAMTSQELARSFELRAAIRACDLPTPRITCEACGAYEKLVGGFCADCRAELDAVADGCRAAAIEHMDSAA